MMPMLKERIAVLPAIDRRLFLGIATAALAALALGILGGLLMALARAGFVAIDSESGYRYLTVHGVSIFFYWLFLAQAVILLAFSAVEEGRGLAWRGAAWIGFLLMLVGFALSMEGALGDTPLLYDGSPGMADDRPKALLVFNLGYILLGLGLLVLPLSAVGTLLAPRWAGRQERLSAIGFALFAWAGFLMVSGFAAVYVFLPGALWALRWGTMPANHTTNWHILFHNMHYLPLMATVIVWYVLMQALTGVHSVFGERFSKIVFCMYLVFVPPTSLYHMFLEPDLPGTVRIAGSLLSLFVSVPTLTAFLIVVASLEVHARSRGGRGLFGWIAMLPWKHPAMAAVGMAVLNMAFGIVFAFVLIQEQLAPLLSDTFFVPGYFHFFTVGTVSLTFLAALAVILPALTGRPIPAPRLASAAPYAVTLGLLLFGGAGVAAGYLGVPRRVVDVAYSGEAPALWRTLMAVVGVGGVIMAAALTAFAAAIAASLLPRARSEGPALTVAWERTVLRASASAVVGPVSVLLIVAAMYVFTAIGFEVMRALPVGVIGGGAAH